MIRMLVLALCLTGPAIGACQAESTAESCDRVCWWGQDCVIDCPGDPLEEVAVAAVEPLTTTLSR